MTRIISGAARGRQLKSPKGQDTRPTGARVRQTLFDILAPRMRGCRFLDAFAGSGAIGLEALSRGASRVVLVDHARDAVQAIRANVDALAAAGGDVRVFKDDSLKVLRALAKEGARFDVVFVDPPYDSPAYEPAIEAAAELLDAGGVVIAEHFHKRALPERIGPLACARGVRVGDHRLSFYTRDEAGGER